MNTPDGIEIAQGRELVLRVWYDPGLMNPSELTDALGDTMRAFSEHYREGDVPNGVLEADYDWAFDLPTG